MKMTDLSYAHILFFALPGFYTLFLVRRIALYKYTMTHVEFVFYSLALSTPSYIAATFIVGDGGTIAIAIVQSTLAVVVGGIVGYVLRVQRSEITRETPWYGFMSANLGDHVVVYTATRSYYGWLKSASTDDEPRRELVLGDPMLIKKDGRKTRMGEAMVFTEADISRVVRVMFDNDRGHTE